MDKAQVSTVIRAQDAMHPAVAMLKKMKESNALKLLKQHCDRAKKNGTLPKLTPTLVDPSFWQTPEYIALEDMFVEEMNGQTLPKDPSVLVGDKPPPADVLYGRIDKDTPIVDIGAGEGKRLTSFPFSDVVTVDPFYEHTKKIGFVGSKQVGKHEHIQEKYDGQYAERVTVSFNGLPQIGYGVADQVDGIHVVPNHKAMDRAGMVTRLEDGRYEVKHGVTTYVDYPTPDDADPITTVSCGYNTFSEEPLDIYVGPYTPVTIGPVNNAVRSFALPEMKDREFTPKFNGEMIQLACDDQGGVFDRVDTPGGARKAFSSERVSLHLEHVKGYGYFLIEIRDYRGYRPFHSLEGSLRKFVRKKKPRLFIDGQVHTIKAPPTVTPAQAISLYERGLAEGVVFREKGSDYYLRFRQSVDLDERGYRSLKRWTENLCVGFLGADPWPEGCAVAEYEMHGNEASLASSTGYYYKLVKARGKERVDLEADLRHMTTLPTAYDGIRRMTTV